MWAWHTADMGWGWWVFGPLMMLAFWGGIIWLFYALFTSQRRGSERQPGQERIAPRDIAKRRLASGDIDEAEFDRIMKKLDDDRPG